MDSSQTVKPCEVKSKGCSVGILISKVLEGAANLWISADVEWNDWDDWDLDEPHRWWHARILLLQHHEYIVRYCKFCMVHTSFCVLHLDPILFFFWTLFRIWFHIRVRIWTSSAKSTELIQHHGWCPQLRWCHAPRTTHQHTPSVDADADCTEPVLWLSSKNSLRQNVQKDAFQRPWCSPEKHCCKKGTSNLSRASALLLF